MKKPVMPSKKNVSAAWLNEELRIRASARLVRAKLHARRSFALHPNEGQAIKLARYSVGLSSEFTTGSSCIIQDCIEPTVQHRTRRVIMNAPFPHFVWIRQLLAANVATTVGGMEDAWGYNPSSRVLVDWPTISSKDSYSFQGEYTGATPAPIGVNVRFRFGISLIGPALLCGDGPTLLVDLPIPYNLTVPRRGSKRRRSPVST
jgi:hypothetical protein